MPENLLAIDNGTQSVRALVFDPRGNLLFKQRIPIEPYYSTAPGLAVYRWGCAGTNNVYLFAHAYAAFGPLHDAYVSGRLRRGMTVLYADGGGRVHTYAVAWWRLTTPDRGAFAYAAQRRPSLTLQTCVGSRSQYRLIVRLVRDS